jgi:uncharacterized protein (DUF433 family)
MLATIRVPEETYQLLQKRAAQIRSTPDAVAETILRLQLDNSPHIEQRPTTSGMQAYIRDTRVAVRHVAAFLNAGHSAEDIHREFLPQVSVSAIYEAISYYYDHLSEIEAELTANSPEAINVQLQERLTSQQYALLTGKTP